MTPPIVRPRPVRPGDTVAIVATSSPVRQDELDRLVRYFAGRGYEVRPASIAPSAATGYLAGPRVRRAADLMAAFTDPTVTLIVPATGGKGAAHLLELLDFAAIRANPKVFTGMSDPSILGNAIFHRAGLVTLHGPSGYDFFQPTVNADTESAFWQMVTDSIADHEVSGTDWQVVRGGGRITGRLLGGHLGTIRALVGTPWMPDVTGAVLALEEVFVPWVAVDAALTHLRLAGMFDRIAALLVGVPVDCPRDDAPDKSWEQLILRCVGGDFPIVTNVEFGHTARKIPLVIGGAVTLDLEAPTPVLRYVDALVAR